MEQDALAALFRSLGRQFGDLGLVTQALRHSSYVNENPDSGGDNQRLEFLGDAVLGLVVAEQLVLCHPEAREGELTRWRAALVSEGSLARAGRLLGLGTLLLLGKGEDAQGGRDKASLLSDAVEALVAAAFLDGGLDAARVVVRSLLGRDIEAIAERSTIDHKSRLQELIQSLGLAAPTYVTVDETGPDHAKQFEVLVSVAGEVFGRATGASKKEAEQAAAFCAIEALGRNDAK